MAFDEFKDIIWGGVWSYDEYGIMRGSYRIKYEEITYVELKGNNIWIKKGTLSYSLKYSSSQSERAQKAFQYIMSHYGTKEMQEERKREQQRKEQLKMMALCGTIEKNVESIVAQFERNSAHQMEALPGIVESMGNDEEIRYVFKSALVEKNPNRTNKESVTEVLNILTNKRFYFAGTDGQSSVFLTMPKSGSVNLKDVHATNLGRAITGDYIGFETRNDDYKIIIYATDDATLVKRALDKALEEASYTEEKTVSVQAAFSAADEIKKFKELLDMGIITQEEFDAKKKQLLGL